MLNNIDTLDTMYLQANKDALTIELYSDAVELANPLGNTKSWTFTSHWQNCQKAYGPRPKISSLCYPWRACTWKITDKISTNPCLRTCTDWRLESKWMARQSRRVSSATLETISSRMWSVACLKTSAQDISAASVTWSIATFHPSGGNQ